MTMCHSSPAVTCWFPPHVVTVCRGEPPPGEGVPSTCSVPRLHLGFSRVPFVRNCLTSRQRKGAWGKRMGERDSFRRPLSSTAWQGVNRNKNVTWLWLKTFAFQYFTLSPTLCCSVSLWELLKRMHSLVFLSVWALFFKGGFRGISKFAFLLRFRWENWHHSCLYSKYEDRANS